MSDSPYIPFYTSDFLGGTSGMTASTKGVYITILCLMYEGEGPIPQKWDSLARRCGCTLPAFKRAISDLEDDGKIEVTENGLWSPKCEKHITQRRERSDSAKAAAKKRWEKTEQKQQGSDADALRPVCQPEPEPDIKEDTNVSLSPRGYSPSSQDVSEAVSIYMSGAEKAGWSGVRTMNPNRTRSLKARLRECGGLEGWREALRRAYASDFIRNEWAGFGIDDLLSQQKFTKLLEGKYDNRSGRNPTRNTRGGGAHAEMLQGFADFANRDDYGSGEDFGGGETSFHPGGSEMDFGSGGYASQPLLRVVNSE